jgi:lysophospholipase L1-like esterase
VHKRAINILKRCAALLMSLLLALLIGEIIVRVFAPQAVSTPMFDTENAILCHVANAAGSGSVPGLWSTTWHLNSQRFRATREYALEPPPNVFRVAAIGDSFTWGIGANDDQTYPARLEETLNSQAPHTTKPAAGPSDFEVINAGVCGTGTGEQALWYEHGVAKFGPKLVLISIFVNDIEDDFGLPVFTVDDSGRATPAPAELRMQRLAAVDSTRRKLRRIPFYNFLTSHSHLVNFLRHLASDTMARHGAGSIPATQPSAAQKQEQYFTIGLPRMQAELRWLNEKVRRGGGRLAIVYFPTRETIYPDTGPDADEARWQATMIRMALAELSARDQIPLLDPTDAFRAQAANRGDHLFFKGRDRHPRPAGYDFFAQQVTTFLRERDLLKLSP